MNHCWFLSKIVAAVRSERLCQGVGPRYAGVHVLHFLGLWMVLSVLGPTPAFVVAATSYQRLFRI